MDKTYLGDGVYAQVEHGMVKLTSENGVSVLDTIYLEPEVIYELLRFLTKIGVKVTG